ncbi:hypothetical protein Cgig2_030114 [Carnegiea gigantea]|uniref:Uncharacterized protein n=1 Tax=Carnegiea gigantea TaxID=171969 RepID=A0A9Q1QCT1_9CARY|nr:hypothetical protein Cgig2_030114 [Carnegiea gigantea]
MMVNPSQSSEEADQLSRSKKKMKHTNNEGELDGEERDDEEMEDSFSDGPERIGENPGHNIQEGGLPRPQGGLSYRDTLQRNIPELSFNVIQNAIWDDSLQEEESGDDELPEFDDPKANQNIFAEAEMESNTVNARSQGSRFCALSELDVNENIGEADMEEKCQYESARMQQPHIIALLEMYISGRRVDEVCTRIGYHGQYRVEAQGFQGGEAHGKLEKVLDLIEHSVIYNGGRIFKKGQRGIWSEVTQTTTPYSSV